MIKIFVNGGACGFMTNIEANAERQNANIKINTECPSLKPLSEELKTINGYEECFGKIGDTSVFQIARQYCKHAACPVPTAIIKGVEAACGLALPRDIEIKITKEE
ncbi:MAG: hypothetical protein FNP40_02420 [Dehalobacter sp. 4CP]|uniref:DUF6951 family protein n=1 Tax=Dehalobacter sp. CP TaxID=2594474 RepID=UPI00031E93AF|nr:hypothetical protein [Dehalobacter sp.]NBJ14429.1 hypothetical protein [Dehalobacter sp. 4CP]